ncbi:MAG: hypothetical protein J0H66_02545 [Solirubrobacterales bacterium]|nr:hypothetical protein [Solirubrobacterales bacterium]
MSIVKAERTSGVDLLVSAFVTLNEVEQQAALAACQAKWLESCEAGNSEASLVFASLRRSVEECGEFPGVEQYRDLRKSLGEEILPFSRVLRFFNGSWHQAREAMDLLEVTTERRIQSRFESRQLGKIWKYTDETLRHCILEAGNAIGRAPQVSEYLWWREERRELAKAKGETLFLPTATPYRNRFGSWEGALLHYGYTQEEIDKRLERTGP